ncbi:hypothetical protein HNR37_002124 [Desulfurispira natronophila]|uniref:AMMECR1 domain-containing protein n=2 Tax=Desulfurispira natronophila TaxID=682562 RepID=A0A7W7Y623_9BACT|nr:hypothetical protein [Desulfurispira natronophila]
MEVLQTEYDIPDLRVGLFVTLIKGGQLRGCIGTFLEQPLDQNLQSMACAAAFNDHRFPVLKRDEFDELRIEVTLMSSAFPIKAEDVEVGRHGLIITMGHHKGVLLPQVAVDHRWDRSAFIEHTCIKAGLPAQAYTQSNCCIEAFEAVIVGEEN